MRNRIEAAMKVGQISEEIRKQNKGFGEWDLVSDPRNHQTILQVFLTVFYALQPILLFTSDIQAFLFIIRYKILGTYIMMGKAHQRSLRM